MKKKTNVHLTREKKDTVKSLQKLMTLTYGRA